MQTRSSLPPAAALLGLALLGLAAAPAAARDLRMAIGGAITSADPHFFNVTPNQTLAANVYDRLIHRSPEGRLVPGLALSWRPVSDTVWQVKLRPDVRWHDGRPFTAEDVRFTFTRARDVPGSPGSFSTYLRAITELRIVDPLTVELVTSAPSPDLPANLASVSIVSRHVGESATTADYNAGTASIGTGAYRLVRFTPNEGAELRRNDDWWGPRQPWDRVELRTIAAPASRTAALLSGDVDVIDTPSTSDLPRLQSDPRTRVVQIAGVRVVYLSLDLSRAENPPFITDNEGQKLRANPFRDRRVREAMSLAINREALAERIMAGTAAPTGQWFAPGSPAHVPDIPVPRMDPAAATRLLAEAGYPQGFRLTFHAPSDRFINGVTISQAVAQMWTRIGIRTEVAALPSSVFFTRGNRQEFDATLRGWGNNSGDASSMLSSVLHTHDRDRGLGLFNQGRYANPRFDEVAERALRTLDDTAREALFQEATRIATADVAMIPLFVPNNIWAVRREVSYAPSTDEMSLAERASPTN